MRPVDLFSLSRSRPAVWQDCRYVDAAIDCGFRHRSLVPAGRVFQRRDRAVAAAEAKGACTQCADRISILVTLVIIIISIVFVIIVFVIFILVIVVNRPLPAATSRGRRSATPDSGRRDQSAVRVGAAGRARSAQVNGSQPAITIYER